MAFITTEQQSIINRLTAGDVAAIPTETVYGLAGMISKPQAIAKIYDYKQRPVGHPLIVHLGNSHQLGDYAKNIHGYAKNLIEHFWPGPLTLVFEKTEHVADYVTGEQDSVAVRQPNHPLLSTILEQLPSPVAAPSANQFGRISPTCAADVLAEFPEHDLAILDGGRCHQGIESTIIDVRDAKACYLLRAGSTDLAEIDRALAPFNVVLHRQESSTLKVPGKMKSHYAPKKPVHLLDDLAELNELLKKIPAEQLILLSHQACDEVKCLNMPTAAKAYAHELYHQLRQADNSAHKEIAVLMPPATEAFMAIREKLVKAAA